MIKRICPKCNSEWYSDDSSNDIWICENCGSEIKKSDEKLIIEKKVIFNEQISKNNKSNYKL